MRSLRSRTFGPVGAVLAIAGSIGAQRPAIGPNVRQYVKIDTATIALTHARVIDGTGAPTRVNQTLLIRDGRIAALGPDGSVQIPAGALTIDLTGKTLIPGIVGLHEHLLYPVGPVRAYTGESFSRLYLAGGVTTIRTAGTNNGFAEIRLGRDIEAGRKPGPWIDATAPYLDGNGPQTLAHVLQGPEDAERFVNYWADAGAKSFKAYTTISRAELAAAIKAAHKRGLKLTGHICSVTHHEAAEMGIDNIEHSFYSISDFAKDRVPDQCPRSASVADMDMTSAPVQALIKELVAKGVSYTSTLPAPETLTPGRPMPKGLEVLVPSLKADFENAYQRMNSGNGRPGVKAAGPNGSLEGTLLGKVIQGDLMFYRAGGLLVAGTDPTAGGGTIAGFSNHRQFELMVEGGFTPLEAIKVMTLNGAIYMGRDKLVGSIATGKQADLVVIAGDPSVRASDINNVEIVFKQGVGYDPAKLIASVTGKTGLW
jgi:imidazolonepropionase-like amidohydrolase